MKINHELLEGINVDVESTLYRLFEEQMLLENNAIGVIGVDGKGEVTDTTLVNTQVQVQWLNILTNRFEKLYNELSSKLKTRMFSMDHYYVHVLNLDDVDVTEQLDNQIIAYISKIWSTLYLIKELISDMGDFLKPILDDDEINLTTKNLMTLTGKLENSIRRIDYEIVVGV